MPDPATADLDVIAHYLARRDVPDLVRGASGRSFDVLALCGSAVLASVELAARAFHSGVAERIVVTGGIGHSTPYLLSALLGRHEYADIPTHARPEAVIFGDILQRHHDVPADVITVEARSTNCGENAELTMQLLARDDAAASVVLLQDPTMQRRTHASFERHRPAAAAGDWLTSFAPLIPELGRDVAPAGQPLGEAVWTFERFISLVLGEIRRLRDDDSGYGPRGANFIDHVDIPVDVLAAYERTRRALDRPPR